jgi:hypothetical protein
MTGVLSQVRAVIFPGHEEITAKELQVGDIFILGVCMECPVKLVQLRKQTKYVYFEFVLPFGGINHFVFPYDAIVYRKRL